MPHRDLLALLAPAAQERQEMVVRTLTSAFAGACRGGPDPLVDFSAVTEDELAEALLVRPELLKVLLANVYAGERAVKQDLGFSVSSYRPRLDAAKAHALAGFVLGELAGEPVTVSALARVDRSAWMGTELRKLAGRWELQLLAAVNARSASGAFGKRRLRRGIGRQVELDLAFPERAGVVQVMVDCKAISGRQDIDKRCAEVLRTAERAHELKGHGVAPTAPFVACLRVPEADRPLARAALSDPRVDAVLFAGADHDSLDRAACAILTLGDLPVLGTPRPAEPDSAPDPAPAQPALF